MNKNTMTVSATALATVCQLNLSRRATGGASSFPSSWVRTSATQPARFPHGGPSPRSQGDRLEGGDDNRLICGLIGAAERLHRVRRSDQPAEGRQELRDVEPTNEFAGSGNRGIERREAGATVGDEQVWRSKIPVGDPGVMELA